MKTHMFKITILTWIILLLSYPANLVAQVTTINGRNFEKQNGKWYQLENSKSYKVDGKIITVKYKTGISTNSINQYQAQKNVRVIRRNLLGFIDLEIPSSSDPIIISQDFIKSGLVEIAEPNTLGRYTVTPNDQYFSNQWSLNNIGQTGGTMDADIDAVEAWNIETGKSPIIIGILDSGVEWTHEDLGLGTDGYQNIWLNSGEDAWADPNDPTTGNHFDDDGNGYIDDWKGWNFFNNNNDTRDQLSHGTYVAGVTAAKTNNNKGIAGVAGGWGAQASKMLIIGVGNFGPEGSILDDAILYAASQGAKIIQMSLGVGQTSAIDAALQTAYLTYGCFIDCAAGNLNGGSIDYPARNQYVVAVTSTDHNDTWSQFSSKGPEAEISAPGSDILTTMYGNSYASVSGTSVAAPHVAGVAALILSINPNLTPAQIRNIIQQSAEDKGVPGRDDYYGYGRVNADQALKYTLENYGGTLSGNIVFREEITISPSAVLNISPGTNILFENGATLTINGTLNAIGTPTNRITFDFNSLSVNGIKLNSTAAVNLSYANIKNAFRGIYLNESEPTIEYCNIFNCTNGLYLFRSDYQLTIYQGTRIVNNKIYNNFVGLNLNESSPLIVSNEFYGNTTAVYTLNTGGGNFGEYLEPGTNYVHDNSKGVHAYNSFPTLGIDWGTEYAGGYNTFTNSSAYHIVSEQGSNVAAEINWWGSSPPDFGKFLQINGVIDINPWLTNPLFKPVKGGGNYAGLPAAGRLSSITEVKPDWDLQKKLNYAKKLLWEGDKINVKKICKEIIQDNMDSLIIYDALTMLAKQSTSKPEKDELKVFINGLTEGRNKKNISLYANLLLLDNDLNDYPEQIDDIISSHQNSSLLDFAYFRKFNHYYFKIEDYESARLASQTLDKLFPESEYAKEAKRIIGEEAAPLKPAPAMDTMLCKVQSDTKTAVVNYPNPFNPTTIIKYSIPKQMRVNLTVYDILGREIITLVNEDKPAGSYEVMFDASGLSSGVYLYKLATPENILTGKMSVVK